ncbi:L,D-transpeptidase [Devosia faecipullorum]|uniref:L,D-transpeptidase n=1 Tax=Devosia faecipullorum TaxID=2755039 RepID=UPI001E60A996|nr:L,D-transpeptidase [Devosia faecipullorum]
MNIIKLILAFGMALALSASLVAPASAATWYNPETNRFEDRAETAGRGGSSIKKQIVSYETSQKPGTIIINTAERRLYLVLEDGKAMKYGIGVGREGFTWSGTNRISRKAEWPGWTPPPAMRKRVPDLPAYMPGGPDNPLGARALYIGSTLYRVHGTSEPWTIGQAVSSGCIRMTNDDVTDLYERVQVGARIVVNH